jgi:predicted nucleic acid-binding Zn finger protein
MSVEETRKVLMSILERGVDQASLSIYEGKYVELKAILKNTVDSWSMWVYMGRERDYILIPYVYCSCMDYLVRTVFLKTRSYCKHQLGLLVAIKKGLFKTITVTLEELYTIIDEILEKGFSITLRRKLYK